MVGHGGSAGSYLADPTSPIPSHCASIVTTSTLRVKHALLTSVSNIIHVMLIISSPGDRNHNHMYTYAKHYWLLCILMSNRSRSVQRSHLNMSFNHNVHVAEWYKWHPQGTIWYRIGLARKSVQVLMVYYYNVWNSLQFCSLQICWSEIQMIWIGRSLPSR